MFSNELSLRFSVSQMLRVYFIVFIAITFYSNVSFGYGINCDGSFWCGATNQNLNDIVAKVCNELQGFTFGPYEHIACGGGNLVAFTQMTDRRIWGSVACGLLRQLRDYGCKQCGSIPLGFPQDNDVYNGELTVNYVTSPNCQH